MKGQGAGLRARLKKKPNYFDQNYAPNKVKSNENIDETNVKYKGFWENIRESIQIYTNTSSSCFQIDIKNRFSDIAFVREAKFKSVLLINPNDRWKINWDLCLGALIMYSIIVIPYRIGFEVEISSAMAINFEYFLDSVFFMDLLFTFNTSYKDEITDNLVIDRRSIALNYAKFWLWIDLFSSIPFDNIVAAIASQNGSLNSIRLIRVLRLIRLLKLFRILKLSKIGDHADRVNINPAIIGVCQLLFQIFFLSHLICCFWHYLTTSDATDNTWNKPGTPITWRNEFGFENSTHQDIYIASFYWTIATMVAVGYGDIRATNNSERGFAIFTMLAGGIMFGAVIAQVSRLIEGRNPQSKLFKEKMREIKAYLAEKPLPRSLKTRVKEAYVYYLQKKTSFEANIMDGLARHLLIKLINNVYDNEIRHIKLFHSSDPSFMTFLVTQAQPFQALRGDVVLKEGDVSEDIIFIMRGLVRIHHFDATKLKIVGYCEEGGYFGDFEYYKKSTRIVSYQALINCSLFSISFKVFDAAIDAHYDTGRRFMDDLKNRFDVFKKLFLSDEVCKSKIESSAHRRPHRRRQLLVPSISMLFKKNEMDGSHPFDNESVWIDGVLKNHDAILAERKISRHLLGHRDDDSLYRVIITGPKETQEQLREENLATIGRKYLMLHPHGTYKKYWDFLIVVLIVYSVLMVPVSIAFTMYSTYSQQVWEVFVDVIFLLDLLLSTRTCYLSEEEDAWVLIPQKVWRKYASSWFLIDLLSSIPFDNLLTWILGDTIRAASSLRLVKIIRITRIIKLFRLLKLSKYFSRIDDVLGINPATFDFLKIVLDVTFIAHLVACVWWGICANVSPVGSSWIDSPAMVYRDDLRTASTSDQYILSLYWTFTTLATVGYGDITPLNSSERILAIFVMMGGATVFGYIVANVATLMGSSNLAENQLNERISEITEYLREKNVPKGLSKAIVRHFKFTLTQVSVFDEETILGRFPRLIRTEVQLCLYRETMLKIPIFKFIKNSSVCLYIFNLMTSEFIDTDQFLVKQNAVGNEITFIVSGRVRVYRSSAFQDQELSKKKYKDNFLPLASGASSVWFRHSDTSQGNGIQRASAIVSNAFVSNFPAKKIAASDDWISAKPKPTSRVKNDYPSHTFSKDGDDDINEGVLFENEGHNDDVVRNLEAKQSHFSQFQLESVSKFKFSSSSRKSLKKHSKDIDHSSSSSEEDSDVHMEHDSPQLKSSNSSIVISLASLRHTGLSGFGKSYMASSNTKQSKSFSKQTNEDFRKKGRILYNELVPGDFFGYVALMNNGRHKASIRAIEPCNVYTLKREDIRRLLTEHPSIAFALQTSLSRAIHENSTELDRAYIKTNRRRFASEIKGDHYRIRKMKYFSLHATDDGKKDYFGPTSLDELANPSRRTKPLLRVSLPHIKISHAVAMPKRLARILPVKTKESKWEILRRAITDAKVQAQNAKARMLKTSMIKNMNVDPLQNRTKFYFSARSESLFTLALKKKIGGDLENVLNDKTVDYDSDKEQVSKYVRLHGPNQQFEKKKERMSTYGQTLSENIDHLQRFINGFSGRISTGGVSDAFGKQKGLIRAHRSASDLLALDMSLGQFSHKSSAQKVENVMHRGRRNSFPSKDHEDWRIIRTKHIHV